MHPRYKIYKDKAYEEWIRDKECLACGKPPRSECHHVWHTGGKNARNSYTSVPLCHECHISGTHAYHMIEHSRFEKHFNLDFKDEIINLLTDFFHKPID